jgi:hypothetical protein
VSASHRTSVDIMTSTLCVFEQASPGVIRCIRCGTEKETADAPEKYRRNCVAASKPEKWRGLGDVVASVTDAIGIPKCGGSVQRQEWLNKMLPFGGAPEAMPQDEPSETPV